MAGAYEVQQRVVDELAKRGVTARLEFQGVVAIEVGDGREWWTGMHGWDYASENVLRERVADLTGQPEKWLEPNEDATPEVDLPADTLDLDPERIADAWAEAVRAARDEG